MIARLGFDPFQSKNIPVTGWLADIGFSSATHKFDERISGHPAKPVLKEELVTLLSSPKRFFLNN